MNKNSFNLSDYFDLDKITEEQIKYICNDLTVFVRGFGFGSNLTCFNDNLMVVESVQKITYDYDYVKNFFIRKLCFEDWQIADEDGCNNIKLIFMYADIYRNTDVIIRQMELLGWSKSYITNGNDILIVTKKLV